MHFNAIVTIIMGCRGINWDSWEAATLEKKRKLFGSLTRPVETFYTFYNNNNGLSLL